VFWLPGVLLLRELLKAFLAIFSIFFPVSAYPSLCDDVPI